LYQGSETGIAFRNCTALLLRDSSLGVRMLIFL